MQMGDCLGADQVLTLEFAVFFAEKLATVSSAQIKICGWIFAITQVSTQLLPALSSRD
jgi:hypothetical protein